MRLIDADKFKKQIVGMTIVNNYPPDKANKLCELIDAQPTAYDVDKVTEQIKEKEKKICCYVKCTENCGDCEHGYLMKGILEIVKSGEVN